MIFHGQPNIFFENKLPSGRGGWCGRGRRGWNPSAISQIKRDGGNNKRQNQHPQGGGFVALAVRGEFFARDHRNDQIVFFDDFVENNRQKMQADERHQHPRHLFVNRSDKETRVFVNQIVKRSLQHNFVGRKKAGNRLKGAEKKQGENGKCAQRVVPFALPRAF